MASCVSSYPGLPHNLHIHRPGVVFTALGPCEVFSMVPTPAYKHWFLVHISESLRHGVGETSPNLGKTGFSPRFLSHGEERWLAFSCCSS